MVGDPRWAASAGVVAVVSGLRPRAQRVAALPAGRLSQSAHVASGLAGRDLVAVAHERDAQQTRVRQQPLHDLRVGHRQVAQTGVAVRLRRLVEQGRALRAARTNRRSSPGAIGRLRRSE